MDESDNNSSEWKMPEKDYIMYDSVYIKLKEM